MTTALAQQTQAMTALVAHLVGQSDLSDLASGSSSSALTDPPNGRSSRTTWPKGNQLGYEEDETFRTSPIESSGVAAQVDLHQVPFETPWLCRSAGIGVHGLVGSSHRRLSGCWRGAQEIAALTLCSVDQACQDGNRWDVAFLIALLEEPPPGVFASRGGGANPRMKAFSPLIPDLRSSGEEGGGQGKAGSQEGPDIPKSPKEEERLTAPMLHCCQCQF